MKTKSRISSILKTTGLDSSITGLQTFDLSSLKIINDLHFQLPTNLRLGHLVETIVSELIKSSTNYKVLYENVQFIEDKTTIGEIDFIISNEEKKEILHLEFAYKFYLYDPTISSETINNWIGPNRNDSLTKKIEKIKTRQFPLLYHKMAKSKFDELDISEVSQALCLLVSLFIPYDYKASFSPTYEKAIKGYYLNIDKFISLNHSKKKYYLPPKKEWGIDPAESEIWTDFRGIQQQLNKSILEKKAPLCWQKNGDVYEAFFVVWW